MRALVAGGTGFIGSHLCERLLADSLEVIAVDNLSTGRRANVASLIDNPKFRLVEYDVSNNFRWDEPVDVIYNMASPASPIDYLSLPIETLMVGSQGTKALLDLARRYEARFLLASTSECYGDPLEHPQSESYWGHVNPIGPRSVYDEAKRFAEALTMAYHRKFGVRTHIARIFNTYGPRMKLNDGRVVPSFLDQVLHGRALTVFGDGKQTRSFCYVSDLVEGLVRLMQTDEAYPVNLGNPQEMTILEFAEMIRKLMGADCQIEFRPLPEDDPRQRRPDITKAKRLLGWEPEVSLEQGLRVTIEHFRAQESVPSPAVG